ncbi:MAG: S-layer homology domain-containing protein [Oscillospiraceae bacterium]|nr:S-layer homology domain-containing protein [Oscillospiraceae bacterium]
MRRTLKFLITLALAAALCCGMIAVPTSASGFSDVDDDAWYAEAVYGLVEAQYGDETYSLNIIQGYDDGTFRPEQEVTRAEFLTMIYRTAETLERDIEPTDHSRDNIHWAGKYYTFAMENNILVADVYSGGVMFECTAAELDEPMSRYEMAVVLTNFLTNIEMDSTVVVENAADYITDYYSIDEQYIYAVEQACGKMMLTGMDDGSFSGESSLRRCEAATIIYRYLYDYNVNEDDGLAEYATRPVASTTISAPEGFVSFAQQYQTMTDAERRLALFGNSNKTYFTSSADAAGYMETVTVPIWIIDRNTGLKTSSSTSITVHRLVADEVQYIFQDIYNDPEQFPIYGGWSLGGARYTDSLRHSWGCAIDVNAYYNCECTTNWNTGTTNVTCGYGWWPTDTAWTSFAGTMTSSSPYSISSGSSVVEAFARYGWGWGGQGYSLHSDGSQKFDFMHFSILPSGG